MGNLSIRCGAFENAGSRSCACPRRSSASMSFSWLFLGGFALQQGPPPLHQPGVACSTLGLPAEHFSSNGKLSLNWLSHPGGQAHTDLCESWPLLAGIQAVDECIPLHFLLGVLQKTVCERKRNVLRE